jgi:2-polyprenyl-3-methyl-5-hydroxy-6-metoxy-1,4-benzoquinol methylase
METEEDISSDPCPKCWLCGSEGTYLHQGLTDAVFSAPGRWNVRRCGNPGCGLVWLDPRPRKEDIGKAYSDYYTHGQKAESAPPRDLASRLLRGIHRWTRESIGRWSGFTSELLKRESLYLGDRRPGRFLDIGCGDGRLMLAHQKLGWETAGIEPDSKAGERARAAGLDVYVGEIQSASFPEGSFDVVLLSHVIEHVYDPISLLGYCHRMLRPGGKLVCITPNVESMAHKRFGRFWRGLEVPRHLLLFSRRTLEECARRSGFQTFKVRSTAVHAVGMVYACRILAEGDAKSLWAGRLRELDGLQFQAREYLSWLAGREVGEELVLEAVRS